MVFVKYQKMPKPNKEDEYYEYYYLYESYYNPGMEYPQNFKVGKVGDDVSSLVSNLKDKASDKDIDIDQDDIDQFKIQLNTVEEKAKEEGIEEDELGEFYDKKLSGEIKESSEMSDSGVKSESDFSSSQNTFLDDSSKEKISSLGDAESFFLDLDIEDDSEESFVVGYLGSDNSLLGYEEIGSGDDDSVNFDHMDVIEGAKDRGSSRVVIAHNHPSGNPDASDDDIVATRALKHDLREEDIELVDHLVLTDNGVGSIRRESELL